MEEGKVYQLKITLKNISPPVWRMIEVPSNIRFDTLARAILLVMGWEGGHMYCFELAGEKFYEDAERTDEFGGIPMHKAKLDQWMYKKRQKGKFIYDFGDNWTHEIMVENFHPEIPGISYPRCTGGARACPPDDSGGAWGYEEYLEALRNPDTPEKKDMVNWIGDDFDPEAFELTDTNRSLKFLQKKALVKKSRKKK